MGLTLFSAGHSGLALAMFQSGVPSDRLTLFVGIAAISLLVQVLMLIGVGIGAIIALKKVTGEIDKLKGQVMPLVGTVQKLVEQVQVVTTDLTPTIRSISSKVDVITGHAEEISGLVKGKVEEFGPTITKANETLLSANQTVMDATTKTHEQLLKVNQMISDTLSATERAGKKMAHNITQPGREIAGIASGLRVAVQTFMDKQNQDQKKAAAVAAYKAEEFRPRSTASVADALRRDKSNDIGL